MHEYILYSQIPLVREQQLLNVLAGSTASQPVPVCEQTLVFVQLKVQEAAPSRKNPKQQVQRQGQGPSYHKLIRNVNTKHGGENEAGTWHFRAEQTPEPGVQNLTSRAVTERPADDLDVAKFKQSDLFKFKRQYTLIGHRFIQGNVVIRMLRFHIPVDTFQNEDAIDAPPMSSDKLKLLDPSGNWILEVTTRVEDTSNGELTDKAKRELLNFQNLMDGAIDLYTPDRLALDTRVRNV